MTSEPTIEGEVTEQSLAIPVELIASFDPDAFIGRATRQADALKKVIDSRHLFVMIQNRKHVVVEGWMTLGALNGLQAFTESVAVDRDADGALEACAIVSARRVSDGVAIAQAQGFCSTKEAKWKNRDEYAVRSMAQTRATSKVFRQTLAWVMTLAGFETTPAEEMPHEPEGERIPNPTAAEIQAEREAVGRVGDKSPERQALIAQASHAWQQNPATAGVFMKDRKLSASITRWTDEDLTAFVAFMKAGVQ